jgi:YfiH family protein
MGGVSRAPFDGLNLARNVGDDPAAVLENHKRFAVAVGYAPQQLYEATQVHGARVLAVSAGADVEGLRGEEADALITDVPGAVLGIRVADCAAVLLATADGRVVGAVHSGWRGTVANIVGKSVDVLCELAGVHARQVYALVCPHIGVDAFEVGGDVVEAISRALPGVHGLLQSGPRRPHLHLGKAILSQLEASGVPPAHVEQLPGCTFQDAARFYSFRRDGASAGRHLAVVQAGC